MSRFVQSVPQPMPRFATTTARSFPLFVPFPQELVEQEYQRTSLKALTFRKLTACFIPEDAAKLIMEAVREELGGERVSCTVCCSFRSNPIVQRRRRRPSRMMIGRLLSR